MKANENLKYEIPRLVKLESPTEEQMASGNPEARMAKPFTCQVGVIYIHKPL